MTPNQYIINEDEWLRIYYVLPEMAHDIHSRPYQSERDAVLDVVKTLHKDIIENNLGWEEICGSLEDIMEELRQKAGE
jgi:hypothetical protein